MSHAHHTMPSGGDHSTALTITSWLTGVYFVIELGIGLWTGSVAVISDAMHTFSAVGGVVLAIVAARIARRPATLDHTFGMQRAEIIGALLNGFFLLIMAGVVIWMGSMWLSDPKDLSTTPMLLAAVGGLIIEVFALRILWAGSKGNLNIRGAFWHIVQTFVGSLIIIVSAVVIELTGFLEIDPLLGMAFGLVLIFASYQIIKEAVLILLETTPAGVDLESIRRNFAGLEGVENVHHTHAWMITSGTNVFSTHVRVGDYSRGQEILHEGQAILDDTGMFHFATMQLETECTESAAADDIDIGTQSEIAGDESVNPSPHDHHH
ncbi:MAG: cation transporter [Chloroflexi bacterium]|jgi:cobalt-zinc-cadmium efflux system protein|nr:cation transporter [Chloroflexota bacterium]MBT4073966.1 cation transporter [Chloroflexota bacterium]MBT4513507.1 cation transporter [Chloroflexota bacterium]MBT5319992.1 cation transporter [Chloroflexota bacterium]MBT6680722.1 cation transporter [Chloroflexota bacterium]